MRIRIIPTSASMVLLGACLLCAQPGTPAEDVSAAAKTRLRVTTMPHLGFGVLALADREGYFAAEGLEVEFVTLQRVYDGIPPLIRGDLDVLAGSLSPAVLNAVSRGGDIRVVSDKGYIPGEGCRAEYLMARKELAGEAGGLEDLSQMKGWRIAIYPASYNEFLLDRILERAGLGHGDVETVSLPYPVLPEAFRKGSIDASVVSEPWVTRLLREGNAVTVLSASEVTPDFQRAMILFGPRLLREEEEAGKRFMTAYLKAVRRFNEGKTDRNVRIMADHTGQPEELIREICWTSLKEDGNINLESLRDFHAWAVGKGYAEEPFSAEELWDPRFVRHAAEVIASESR